MAIVVGESGAWREIVSNLRQSGLVVHLPNDIEPLLTSLRATYQPSVDRKHSEVAQGIADINTRIANLRAEKGAWRSFINWFRIWRCNKAIARLQQEERKNTATLSGNINKLTVLLKSRELMGAKAEVEVISRLSRLPAGHTVFNDLRLIANRYIYFDGAALQSAQIDHLVLSPAGVFVIETKRWSKHFVESGDYHDPFDQIRRAAYLCYDELREAFGKIHVRSVIACAGELPSAPEGSYVKVLPVDELVGYISWFRQSEITPEALLRVRHFFEGFIPKR
ncbi:MAG: NERD domain-containing protein [Elusimicrobia bacterium]|nr:NERD domain-containing protein [Elusimicrobiota bacterium]MBK8422910.1 NERD domain-containing protein [Elusimicrobiota bacterium]MBK9057343.1 NERD domain-containing protein [Elusimicrobiota bacterium]MBK9428916.1 NERD domain-containing protein [Elusimicrobiota bacterium]